MKLFEFLKRKFLKRRRKETESVATENEGQQRKIMPSLPSADVNQQVLTISNTLRLTAQGMPVGLSREHRDGILLSLMRNMLLHLPERPYARGERLYQGKARLRIGDEVYNIVYTLDAVRAITALNIYKQAFDIVTVGASVGTFDTELSKSAAEYFRRAAWQELLLSRYQRNSKPNGLELTVSKEDKR